MRIRTCFVSNSSSASFTIKKSRLSLIEIAKLLSYRGNESDHWRIYEDGDVVRGYTIMDNGGLEKFLEHHGMDDVVHIIDES